MTTIDVRSVTFVRAAKDAVWDALTNPETIEQFHPTGMRVVALPEGGHELKSPADGASFIREPLVAQDKGHRIELGFEPVWTESDGSSRVVFTLTSEENATKVELTQTNCASFGIGDNWDRFMSSMKSFLETGSGLHIPPRAQA